jgi:hypothetical protein
VTAAISLGRAVRDPDLLGGSVGWWPAQLELLDSLDSDAQLHIWAIARQSGKSTMAAALSVHNACLRPDLDAVLPRGRTRYVLVGAAGQDQSAEFIRVCAALIEESPLLAGLASVRAERIDFAIPRTGPRGDRWTAKVAIRAMPANSRTTRGLSASLLVLDEFAHAGDTAGPGGDAQLYAALMPSLRAFGARARTVIISTPNGPSGKFYELHEAASGGVLRSARARQASVVEIVPDVDAAWLDARRAELGEGLFAQEFEAAFVDAGGSFFDLSEVEFADEPVAPADGEAWVAALDPAFHADSFGVALVGRSRWEPGRLVVGAVASIKPLGSARSFEARRGREDATLEAVWELVAPYSPSRIVSDQHNSAAIESYFGRKGVGVEVVNLTRPLQTAAFVSLRARLVDGSLRCWREPQLVEELRRVRAKDTETIYLPRYADSHCDAAAALALGVRSVDETGGPLVAAKIVPSGASRSPIPSQSRYSSSEFG